MTAMAPRSVKPGRPDWAVDGKDWPNRGASRFVRAGGLQWHVQVMGDGPALLLLHGTGAATHSWRDLMPILARYYTVVAPDLPGHGFTDEPDQAGMSLPGMAHGVAALMGALGVSPRFVAGHSAGAAVLLEMCGAGAMAPRAVVSLNGALLPFQHAGGAMLAPLARLFARTPMVPFLFSMHAADGRVVARLLRGTGSTLDAAGEMYYARLARKSGHARAALTMMANWDLSRLQPVFPKLKTPLLLVVGANDRSIPPADAVQVARLAAAARVVTMPGLGHLAHEEKPVEVAALIRAFCA